MGAAAARLAGLGLAGLLAPLEPARYAPRIAPRAFLMVNGEGDSLVPRERVLELYAAAGAPKALVWVAREHVQPDEAALVGGLAGVVGRELARRGLLGPAARAALE